MQNNEFIKYLLIVLGLLIAITLITNYIHKEEDFQLNITSEALQIEPVNQEKQGKTLIHTGTLCVEKIVLSGKDIRLKIPGFKADKNITDVEILKNTKSGQDLEIILPKLSLKGEPYIELTPYDEVTAIRSLDIHLKKDQKITYTIDKEFGRVKFSIQPSSLVTGIKFDLKSFKIKLKNCRVSYPPHKEVEMSDKPNEEKNITGEIVPYPREVEAIITEPNATKEITLYLKKGPVSITQTPECYMYGLTFNDKTTVQNPTFMRTKTGRINIFENKQINLETDYLPDSVVSIDTHLRELDKFRIGSEGIFIAMKSSSKVIKINGKNKTRSYLDILLENKALALIVGFIIIVADKWILILFQKNSNPGTTSPNTEPGINVKHGIEKKDEKDSSLKSEINTITTA